MDIMSTGVQVMPAPYVAIPLAATITGLSEKAIRRKIEAGVWLEGRQYRRGPDGHIYISVKGYAQWVEAGAGLMSAQDQSESRSRMRAGSSGKRST